MTPQRSVPATPAAPRTAAGRALLDYLRENHHSAAFQTLGMDSPAYMTAYNPSYQSVADALPLIEQEAAADGLDATEFAEWAEQVETFPSHDDAYRLISTTDLRILATYALAAQEQPK